jgi:hypothetical protein
MRAILRLRCRRGHSPNLKTHLAQEHTPMPSGFLFNIRQPKIIDGHLGRNLKTIRPRWLAAVGADGNVFGLVGYACEPQEADAYDR